MSEKQTINADANADANADEPIVVATVAIGSADGDRIAGLIGAIVAVNATDASPDGSRPAKPFRFTVRGSVGASVARRSQFAKSGTYKQNVDTRPDETAALLAHLGIDSTEPTVEMVTGTETFRTMRATITANAAALTPVALVFPVSASTAPTTDAETATRLARAALAI